MMYNMDFKRSVNLLMLKFLDTLNDYRNDRNKAEIASIHFGFQKALDEDMHSTQVTRGVTRKYF